MKAETDQIKPRHRGWNILLVLIVSISLIVVCYGGAVLDSIGTAAKLQSFLHQSKAFSYTADIIKAEVSDRLPQKIKDNVIEAALISKFMDFVITPDNIERLAEPGLKLTYKAADTPTSIVDNKVVINTTTYKSQANTYINSLNLSESLKNPAQTLIGSVPAELVLVDNTKHPNNALAILIQVRNSLRTLRTVVTTLWWIIPIAFLILILINLRSLRRLAKSLTWLFAIPAVFVIVGSWLLPALISVFGARSSDPVIGDQINGLINAVSSYLFGTTRNFGFVCLVLAVIFGLVYYFMPFSKIQNQLDSQLDRLHPKPKAHKSPSTHK